MLHARIPSSTPSTAPRSLPMKTPPVSALTMSGSTEWIYHRICRVPFSFSTAFGKSFACSPGVKQCSSALPSWKRQSLSQTSPSQQHRIPISVASRPKSPTNHRQHTSLVSRLWTRATRSMPSLNRRMIFGSLHSSRRPHPHSATAVPTSINAVVHTEDGSTRRAPRNTDLAFR